MFRRFVMIVIALAMVDCSALAGNDIPVRDMQQVVASDTRLSSEQKARLQRIISDVLSTAPELGEDKCLHAGAHLRQYLDDNVRVAQQSPKRFQLFEDTFRWALGNYQTLAPIREQERQAMRNAIAAMSCGIQRGIDAVYIDTPEPLRAELARRVQSTTDALLDSKKIGNYFYLQYLYPPKQEVSPDKVHNDWISCPAAATKRQAFSEAVQQEAGETQLSHERRVKTFLAVEAAFLEMQTNILVFQYADRTRIDSEHFTSMPKELEDAYQEIRMTGAREDREHRDRRKELEAEVNRLRKQVDEVKRNFQERRQP